MDRVPADLHAHSTASDGMDPPDRLPALALEAGLSAWALTDHDTTDGLPVAAARSEKLGVEFVPGIELSADPGPDGGTLHVLGYCIQSESSLLRQLIERVQRARRERNPKIIQRLQALGVAIEWEEVVRKSVEGLVGRPHVAAVLVEKGYAKTLQDAFTRYLGEQGAAYVSKERPSASEAIQAIHAAGGLASLAHPVQLRRRDEQLHRVIGQLTEAGLDALEVHHPDHGPRDRERFEQLAERFGLLVTGGSDYHGANRQRPLGSCTIQTTALVALREAVAARN